MPTPSPEPLTTPSSAGGTARKARITATAAATIGALLCLLVPLLPVRQTTADILWPQSADTAGNIVGVTAPLVSGAPQSFEAHIPCTAVASLPAAGGIVLSTAPDGGLDASRHGLFVRATSDLVVVAFRDHVAAVAPRQAVQSGGCTMLDIWANAGGVGANFAGIPNAAGTVAIENKPLVTGLFTDLKVPADSGITAHVVIDTRFITSPTTLKLTVTILGLLTVALSLGALATLDRGEHRARRALPKRGRPDRAALVTNGVADILVIGTLLLWHVIGAITSDDGNVLVQARVAHNAGYVAEYYRYFGATASPFDWYATVLSWLTQVSTVGVWMRLPATLAGIGTWYILRRRMLPRLGEHLAATRTAVWTAALVFLTAWLPFNNGLRPEPIIVLGTVVTWALVERAIATRRLTPAAFAIVVALLAATVAPQGLIALGPLLAGARAVVGVVAKRRTRYGRYAPVAVLAASAAAVVAFTFRDQTLATVAESARIKYVVGPTIAWYQEFLRYYFLTVESNVDGSLARRIAVLILLLCLFGTIAVLLRRGMLPGLASGPVWRLIGSTSLGLLLLTFTPTKWAIQFGIFAGLAGALGAVAAFTFARVGLHSRRNLTLYVTALLFILAWATSGINGWFYVGNYGVPWYDKQPVLAGHPVTTMFLVLSVITALLAGWQHFRLDYAGHTEVKNTRRNRLLASTPLMIVAAIMVVLEVASMAKGVAVRRDTYTTGKANLLALAGRDLCAMASDVLVERDANDGLLQPVPGQHAGKYGPLGGADPVGFTPTGVGTDMTSEPVVGKPGLVNSDASPNAPITEVSNAAGTTGGYGPVGINGSNALLPFGLDPARTPVMGSYGENSIAAHLKSSWYQLPPPSPDRPLLVISAAGAIWSFQQDGTFDPTINYGQPLKLEWGAPNPDGTVTSLRQDFPIDIGPQKVWRNLRFPMQTAPPGAQVVRIVADDPNLSSDQWLAFTPPRVPTLETANALLGSQTPVLLDMAVAQNFPCQRPFSEHLGVAELPEYRVMPDHKQVATSSNMWESAEDGGPFMFTTALLHTSTVPTYLRNDWYRDWGSIEKYERIVGPQQAPDAHLVEGTIVVNGWTRKGPIRALP